MPWTPARLSAANGKNQEPMWPERLGRLITSNATQQLFAIAVAGNTNPACARTLSLCVSSLTSPVEARKSEGIDADFLLLWRHGAHTALATGGRHVENCVGSILLNLFILALVIRAQILSCTTLEYLVYDLRNGSKPYAAEDL